MKKLLLLTSILASFAFQSNAQFCDAIVSPLSANICPGEEVIITGNAVVSNNANQSFNFNGGSLPTGWSTTGTSAFSSPCGSSLDGTAYYWASTAVGTPQIVTDTFDVSCGGDIIFDMRFAVQGGAAPCEGPDLAHEGVTLQYSLDNGATWIDILYYSPGGYTLPSNPGTSGSVASGATPYTVWNTFTVPIPLAAMSTSTKFRWVQVNSSGTCCDNWGLDNIFINAGGCNTGVLVWSNGYIDSTQFTVTPPNDTIFVAMVYDTLGNFLCQSDTIFITVIDSNLIYNLPDTVFAYCPETLIPVEATNFVNNVDPLSFQWSNNTSTNPTELSSGPNEDDEIWYYLTITDGCGYTYPDSVLMIENQILQIDTMVTYPASACAPNGAASAFVSGQTTVLGQPYYNWTGPGNPGTYNVDASVISNVPSGWYYFTVTDDVCTVSDSAYIDFVDPPIANLSASPLSGCAPLDVTLTNTSQNSVSFYWDFGNGNTETVNTTAQQTETFMDDAVVMLVAFDQYNCSDTAYVTLSVEPCGCMDPNATNYNPFALYDDGSCVYPAPTVHVPNVFTPNNDNDNDFFELTTTNTITLSLTITNRWGNLMYQGDGIDPKWNGKTKSGNEAEDGVYFYQYELTGLDGSVLSGHGFLHLVRSK